METKDHEIRKIWQWYWDGMIRQPELMARLDRLHVRGAVQDDGRFVGYDYDRQRWLEVCAGM
jgi:hypothetical protein